MATGGPDSWSLIVQWNRDDPTFYEERNFLHADRDGTLVEVSVGSDDWEPAPGVMTGAFKDSVRFIPGNPLSLQYPYVGLPSPTTFSVTKGGTTWTRHRGEMSTSAPVLPGGDVSQCEVQFESVDVLGKLAGMVFRDEFVERWRATARDFPADIAIIAPSTSSVAPTEVTNVGTSTGRGRIVKSNSRSGTVETTSPDGVLLSQAWQLSKNDSTGIGPILVADCYDLTPVDIVIPFRTADRIKAGKVDRFIAQGLDAAGGEEWSLRMRDNAGVTDLRFFDSSGGSALIYAGFAGLGDSDEGDDQWFALRVLLSAGEQFFQLYRIVDRAVIGLGSSVGYQVGRTRRVVVGGNLTTAAGTARALGSQVNCVTMQVGAIVIAEGVETGHIGYLDPLGTEPATIRITSVTNYAGLLGGGAFGDTAAPRVRLSPLGDRDGLSTIAEVCRTTGGVAVASRATVGAVRYFPEATIRGATPVVTLSIEGDVGPQVSRIKAVTPSRVTASWSGGEVVWDRGAAVRIDETIEVAATTETQALHAAQRHAASTSALRVSEVTVDLSGAAQDVWAAMMALQVGDRVRLSIGQASIGGVIPPLVQHYGVTWVDLWVTGWTERYAEGLAEFALRTIPADDPIEGTWETDLRGRWSATPGSMTVTGGTASGGVGAAGTLIVTIAGAAATNPAFSTNAGDYPLLVDWNGELRTVNSAPAAASGSPRTQTLTVAAGAVAPSLARLHAAGEAIDVALPATWAP